MADELVLRIGDLAGIGLLRIGPGRVISAANESVHRILGRASGKLVGRTVLEAFLDHRVADLLDESAARSPAQTEIGVGGEPQRTFLIRATSDDASGDHWLVVHDLSELRRLQRIRTEFVDNVAHELRTPLTNVRLLAETMAMEIDGGAQVPAGIADSVARIEVETTHLSQMVNELLDLARIEQSESPQRRDRVELGEVVSSAVARLKAFADRQSVNLVREASESAESLAVTGDGERLEQMLINLVHNAIKFSAEGAEVVLSAAPDPSDPAALLVAVRDSGPGVPRHALTRVFERFYKVDRARSRGGQSGTGLGLAIAKHIAEAHQGRIWVESREGEGATFLVRLPRA